MHNVLKYNRFVLLDKYVCYGKTFPLISDTYCEGKTFLRFIKPDNTFKIIREIVSFRINSKELELGQILMRMCEKFEEKE